MKKFLALSLVLAAATIAKGAVPSSVEVRRGGLIPTNSPTAGLYLASDGSNYYWAVVTASNTNIPPYTLTNNQSSAVTLLNDLSVSQLLQLPGTGGGSGARVSGRADAGSLNITNFIRNFGWVTTDGPLTNAVGLFNANDSPSYFLNLAGAIAGTVSASSLQNTNVITTNAYVGVLRVSGLQTNSTDQRIVGSNPKLYVQALSAPNTTFLDAHGLGTVSGGSQPYIIFSIEGNQVLYLTDTNFLPAPGINYSLGQGAAGNIFSGIFASNVTIYTSVTNKYLPTNSIMRVGPGGIITTSIIGSGLTLAADGTLSASGALTWSGEAEFDSLIVTNNIQYIVDGPSDATNIVLSWTGKRQLLLYPSNNFAITFSDSPTALREVSIEATIVLTNGQTSGVLPYAGRGGDTNVAFLTAPSTNTIVFKYDGANTWCESAFSGLDSTQFSSDGRAIKSGVPLTNVVLYGTSLPFIGDVEFPTLPKLGPGARVVLDEEFWAVDAGANGIFGREYWTRAQSGTAFQTNGITFPWGTLDLRTIGANSRCALYINQGRSIFFTNQQVRIVTRIAKSHADLPGDGNTNTLKIGAMSVVSGSQTNGVFFMCTNGNWYLVTARLPSVTTSSIGYPESTDTKIILAAQSDSTGTNIYFYAGTSATNLSVIATNSTNIPHDTGSFILLSSEHGLTNNLPGGITNSIDYLKIHVQ